MLLSRVAENLYWASRYLERAEATARVVREHTHLMVDIPTSVPVTWEPLLAITGSRTEFDATYPRADEGSIIRFLVADLANPGSVLASVEAARENLRTTREVLPREVWAAVNDLFLYVVSNHTDGVARRGRAHFLDRVVAETQRMVGITNGTMSRDEAYEFLRLGRVTERADMTTRVLDVRAGSLVAGPDAVTAEGPFDEVQWMSVLRSLSALQMYHRSTHSQVEGHTTLRFLLTDERFPRSVAFCLREVDDALGLLPRFEPIVPAVVAARTLVAGAPLDALVTGGLHDYLDDLQLALSAVHDRIAETFFRPARAGTDRLRGVAEPGPPGRHDR